MNYALLEDEIVARLAPLVTAGHEVEVMPSVMKDDSPVEYKGRITVQVGMAKFDQEDLQSQSATSEQYENTYVELIIRSRRLRTSGGHAGVYELSELCRKLLMGWRSSMSWMPFVCVDFSPINPENIESGVFMYSLRMMTRTIVGPTDEADLSPLIEQITLLPDTQVGPLMPTAELFASAYSVDNAGDQVMLAWISENGYSVTLSGVGEVDAIGSATVTISADTTFTLTVTRGANVATATVEVTVGSNCSDSTVQLNGTTVGTIPSGDSDSFTVNLDGSPSGVWDGTAWQVTSPPCDDATIELNGVEMTTIPSGDTENILVLQSDDMTQVGSKQGTHWRIDDSAISINGSPVADVKSEDPLDIDVTQGGSLVGSWDGSAWIVPPCPTPASIAVSASDTNPNLGDSITITATPSNITPISYTFYLPKVNGEYEIVTQVSNVYVWTAEGNGAENVLVAAVDALGAMAHGCVEVDVIFPFVYEQYAGMSTSYGIFKASSAYTGDWAQVQRQSDGAYLEVGWVNGCIADFAALRNFAGLDAVQITILYDSTGNGNHWTQTVAVRQIEIANSGGVQNYQNSFYFRDNYVCDQTTVGTNYFIGKSRVDLYGCMDATTTSEATVWLFMRGTNPNNCFMLLGASGSATTSINAAFGTPSYYLNGSLASWTNRGAVYSALVGTGYNTISIIGGNTTSGNWSSGGFLGQAFTLDMIGNYGTLWMWTVDTSANRTAIEAKLNVLKNISID